MYELPAAYDRVRCTPAHIVALYDPKVFDRYPDGVVSKG